MSPPRSRWSSSASRPRSSSTRYSPIDRSTRTSASRIDWARVGIVALILVCGDRRQRRDQPRGSTSYSDAFPFIGVGVWVALAGLACRCAGPTGRYCRRPFKGTLFLLALVICASMMPVEKLPAASWQTRVRARIRLGGVRQHPADRARVEAGRLRLGISRLRGRLRRLDDLVRIVGRGRAVQPVSRGEIGGRWVRGGWHVAIAYVIGFFVMLAVIGWHPRREKPRATSAPPSRRLLFNALRRPIRLLPAPAAACCAPVDSAGHRHMKMIRDTDELSHRGCRNGCLRAGDHAFRGRQFRRPPTSADLANVGGSTTALRRSSIRSGSWQLCSDTYFRGQCVTSNPGSIRPSARWASATACRRCARSAWSAGGARPWRRRPDRPGRRLGRPLRRPA